MKPHHPERHVADRIGWLRAAVLGANDGLVSTASLIVGVSAGGASRSTVLLAGFAGLVAGALSMAAGEYVSVSSQSDAEQADLARERRELEDDLEHEREELAAIYRGRGLDTDLARQVALQLMEHDALGAHARDELGMSTIHAARPLQAALASAATFALGAVLPVTVAALSPVALRMPMVAVTSLVFLALLGALGARAGGAPMGAAAVRVTFWGVLAMTATALVGKLFHISA